MKDTLPKESTVLHDVRRIKEEIAREAEADPGYYRKLNGQGARLLASYRKSPATMQITDDDKQLIAECWETIRQDKKASTSNLQRRLRLGYNRAAYVIDYLEKIGVLAPGEGAKPREILVDLETYELTF